MIDFVAAVQVYQQGLQVSKKGHLPSPTGNLLFQHHPRFLGSIGIYVWLKTHDFNDLKKQQRETDTSYIRLPLMMKMEPSWRSTSWLLGRVTDFGGLFIFTIVDKKIRHINIIYAW